MFRCSYLTVCHTTNVWNFTQYVIKRYVWNSTCHITGPSQNSTCHQTYLSRKTSQNILYSKWYIKKSCSACSVLSFMICLSRSAFPVLAVFFWLFNSFCSALASYSILAVLCWQPCPSNPIRQSCRGSPVLAVLFCLSCSACLVMPVRFCLSRSACPVLPVLFWLSSSACPVLDVLFCLSSSVCFALPVLSAFSTLPLLFCLSCFSLSCSACPIRLFCSAWARMER